jgi:hypothetical protein
LGETIGTVEVVGIYTVVELVGTQIVNVPIDQQLLVKFGKNDPPVHRGIESCDQSAMVFPCVNADDCRGGIPA